MARAVRSLSRDGSFVPAATVGVVRPRVMLSPCPRALGALPQSSKHARYRDPLRIWLAQVATDLQWPWPAAARRFYAWLEALEWARDDEARRGGIEGEDLAEAVLAATRLAGARAPALPVAPAATADADALRTRIARLLGPLPAESRLAPRTSALVAGALLTAVAAGAAFGEAVLSLTLKIDQSFVRDIITDPDDAAIVTVILAMAQSLKLAVVAEGVETEEQFAFLAARHCRRMQGYLFSHPLPPEDVGELLERYGKA